MHRIRKKNIKAGVVRIQVRNTTLVHVCLFFVVCSLLLALRYYRTSGFSVLFFFHFFFILDILVEILIYFNNSKTLISFVFARLATFLRLACGCLCQTGFVSVLLDS